MISINRCLPILVLATLLALCLFSNICLADKGSGSTISPQEASKYLQLQGRGEVTPIGKPRKRHYKLRIDEFTLIRTVA